MTMQMNHISGEFPVELRSLPGLYRLRLDSNHLSGTLGDMVGLDSLDSFFGQRPRWLPAADELSAAVQSCRIASLEVCPISISGPLEICSWRPMQYQDQLANIGVMQSRPHPRSSHSVVLIIGCQVICAKRTKTAR